MVWGSQEYCLVQENMVFSMYKNKDFLLVIVRQVNVHILGLGLGLGLVSIGFLLFWVL